MQNTSMKRVGLVGLLLGMSALGGCSTGEGIAVGAAMGALAGYAVSSLDDSDVQVRSDSYTSYGYGPGLHRYSHWDGWDGYSHDRRYGYSRPYRYWDRGWGWRGPGSAYRCDY